MKIDAFKGLDVRSNRWTVEENALQVADNVKVDRGRLARIEGNSRMNAASLGASIMGIYDYKPNGAMGKLLNFVGATIVSEEPFMMEGPTVGGGSTFFTIMGADLYMVAKSATDPSTLEVYKKDSNGWSLVATKSGITWPYGCTNDGTNLYIRTLNDDVGPTYSVYKLTGATFADTSFPVNTYMGKPYYINGKVYCSEGQTNSKIYSYSSGVWSDVTPAGLGAQIYDYAFIKVGSDAYCICSTGAPGSEVLSVIKHITGTTWTTVATGPSVDYSWAIHTPSKVGDIVYFMTEGTGGSLNSWNTVTNVMAGALVSDTNVDPACGTDGTSLYYSCYDSGAINSSVKRYTGTSNSIYFDAGTGGSYSYDMPYYDGQFYVEKFGNIYAGT